MAGRIITLQRQVRELGRLRAGLMETGKNKDGKTVTYPTSSKTWILTSANRDYLDAAAQLWGGEVHEWQPQGNGAKAWRLITTVAVIDAILPPGDPLSQHQEMWSRGGCQRRCDGEREILSDQPCICRAQFGDDFHEQTQGTVCDIHTRLNVFLPDLPDIGVWRAESKGFWPANHIAGYVDMIKAQVGPQVMVPVRLRIEPKTKVKAGKTSQYIEIVVELRSQASFAQILAAPSVIAIGAAQVGPAIGSAERTAIGSAPAPAGPDYFALANEAREVDKVKALWRQANEAGAMTKNLDAHLKARVADLTPVEEPSVEPEPFEADTDEAEVEGTSTPVQPSPPAGGRDFYREANEARQAPTIRVLWSEANRAGVLDQKLADHLQQRVADLEPRATAQAKAAPPLEAETEPNADMVWTAILGAAAPLGWDTTTVQAKFADRTGMPVSDANGWHLQEFLNAIKSGDVK
jgi:hypothetical protein